MKKISSLFAIFLFCAVSLFAQAPEKFTYQAIVRNASNALAANAQVGVRVNILQGSAIGDAVYSESHVTSSNANGLITVNIGGGSVLHGSFASIDWSDGPYYLKTDIDPNGGNDYSITSTQQLLSVPYALYAKEAANSFSGDYNDLANTPTIPTIPTNVSALTNDAGYITGYIETDPQFNAWDKDYNDLINKPTIPTVPTNISAFTNDAGYITLDSIPAIPSVPTNVSAFNNDAGYITGYTETDPQFNAWDKNYNDLINKPVIPTIPTNVSAFNNDAGYITSYTETDPQFNAWDKNYNDLTNKPILFDGNYNSLSNKPELSTVATTGSYTDLNNRPTIPTVPSNVSAFTNDAHYITDAQLNALLASMNSRIDSLRDRIEELETGIIPVVPDTTTSDSTVIPTPFTMVDGQPCPNMATVTDYDGNVYNTVAIGQQCWIKENLRTTHSIDGTSVSYYANTNTSIAQYGYLYSWNVAMLDICPIGWHLPCDEEWIQLTDYMSGQPEYVCGNNNRNIALAMVANTGWNSSANDCAPGKSLMAHGSTGFDILPAGSHNTFVENNDDDFGYKAYFWSSTQFCCGEAGTITISFNSPSVNLLSTCDKSAGLSVRCVRNITVEGDVSQTVLTTPVFNIASSIATCGGIATSENGLPILERGVCWGTTPSPTIAGDHTSDGSGTGNFTSNLFGLSPNTTYYVRAYISSNAGTAYGNELSFTTSLDASFVCGVSTISDYDGNNYNTVQIGNQCWMKENMRTTHYANGTAITQGTSSSSSNTIGYYYNPESSTPYGYHYNWPATKGPSYLSANSQGVCPSGWHVPSDEEWVLLIQYVRNQNQYVCGIDKRNIAKSLAASTGWSSDTSHDNCIVGNLPGNNNATGFSALPGPSGCAVFWSSTESTITDKTITYGFCNTNNRVSCYNNTNKSGFYSVRCLRD